MLFIINELFYATLSFYFSAGITLLLTKYRSTFAALTLSFLIPLSAQATVVEIRTVLGDIQVNLFDETTPATVANFLDYVNSGAYANNVVHRVEPNFVVQAGGFQYNAELPLDEVQKGTPVTNEPELSNLRGTIAMAKAEGNPNSATSEWFFNLANNSSNLDAQNGGFTVFGQVIGDGMQVVDAITAITRFNAGGAFTSLPLRDYDGSSSIVEQNLVLITDIVVIDGATVTNAQLNPVANTLINPPVFVGGDPESGGGGGGSISWLLALVGFGLLRKRMSY
ncbi:MAG: peptidyl-prolyl cis-trans isomerase A (cyclophilin A) [Paraglaciecola sp.]|jgi:peptidyl-prolyl cis-trans isomerase A (cyclophilin A)